MVYSGKTVGNSRKVPECRRIFQGQIGQVCRIVFVAWIFGGKTCQVVLGDARAVRVNSTIVYRKTTPVEPRENWNMSDARAIATAEDKKPLTRK